MYIQPEVRQSSVGFPRKYDGQLDLRQSQNAECRNKKRVNNSKIYRRHPKMPIKEENKYENKCKNPEKKTDVERMGNEELLLLGIILFIYLECDKTRDNILLIAALGYLLIS